MKFTWKKRLLSVVCAVMAAVMFVGCGSSSSSAAANSGGSAVGSSSTEGGEKERREITATVMQSRNVPGLQKMIDKLAEEENIVVDLQVVPDDQYDNLIKMKLNSGEAPDLIDYNMPKICGFLGNEPEKYLVDLSDEPWVERMFSPENYEFDGKIYGYPFCNIAGFLAMLYNKDVFEAAGITEAPTTKDEFNAACEKIKAIDVDPILLPSDSWVPQIWMTAGYAQAMGTTEAAAEFSEKLFTNQDKLTNHPEMAAVIDDFVSNVTAGYVNDDWMTVTHDECIQRLATGKGAMYYQNGVSIVANIAKSFPDANIGMFLYPAEFNANGMLSVTATSPGFSVWKDSKNLETAKEVLRLFSEPDYAELYYTEGNGRFPALKDVDGGEIPQVTLDFYNKYIEEGKTVVEMNTHWNTIQALQSSTLWIYYQEAAQGKMGGEELLERFQVDVDKYMKELQAPGF